MILMMFHLIVMILMKIKLSNYMIRKYSKIFELEYSSTSNIRRRARISNISNIRRPLVCMRIILFLVSYSTLLLSIIRYCTLNRCMDDDCFLGTFTSINSNLDSVTLHLYAPTYTYTRNLYIQHHLAVFMWHTCVIFIIGLYKYKIKDFPKRSKK